MVNDVVARDTRVVPRVAPWLRGWDRDEPQTSVVWRKHLPCLRLGTETTANPKMVTSFFRAAPIHVTREVGG